MFRTFVILLLISSIHATSQKNNQKTTPVLIFCAKDCGGCRLEDGRAVNCRSRFNNENVALRGELSEQNKAINILFALEVFCTNSETCAAEREFGIQIRNGETSCFITSPTPSPAISQVPIVSGISSETLLPSPPTPSTPSPMMSSEPVMSGTPSATPLSSPPKEIVETQGPEVDPYGYGNSHKKLRNDQENGSYLEPLLRQVPIAGGCRVSSKNARRRF